MSRRSVTRTCAWLVVVFGVLATLTLTWSLVLAVQDGSTVGWPVYHVFGILINIPLMAAAVVALRRTRVY
jgi:hypothetical protein